MSGVVFAAVVAVVLVAFAGGYVWGWLNGSASAQHPDGPETCRAKLRAAERSAETWKARARQLEGKLGQLEHSLTVTVSELLVGAADVPPATPGGSVIIRPAIAAGYAPEPLALPAMRR